MCWLRTFHFIALLLVIPDAAAYSYLRVCVYNNWSQYRPVAFLPRDIDPSICSHVIFTYATTIGNDLAPTQWNDRSSLNVIGLYEQLNDLKAKNLKLRTLLSVGGDNFESSKMASILSSSANMTAFVKSAIAYIKQEGFDGLDIDFRYPLHVDSLHKKRFTRFLQMTHLMFKAEALDSRKNMLLLSVAASAKRRIIDAAYEVKIICKYVDMLNLMTLDFHDSQERTLGFNAPLIGRKGGSHSEHELNVNWAAKYWIDRGCPAHKILLVMPTYGRVFVLHNPVQIHVGARTHMYNRPPLGDYTKTHGLFSYGEICRLKATDLDVHIEWNSEQSTSYLYTRSLWISYDDERSLRHKVRWLKQRGLGGWVVWTLDMDDYSGLGCNNGRFPLTTELNKILEKPVPSPPVKALKSGALAIEPHRLLALGLWSCRWLVTGFQRGRHP